MSESIIETEILKLTESLNLEIYSLFCKLDRYKDKLSEPIYKYMSERLYTLYKEEFDRITAPYFLERSRERFQAQERRETLAPHRWRPWYFLWLKVRENHAAKLIVKEIEKETKAFFAACEKRLALSSNEPPAPQNPEKAGTGKQDQQSDRLPNSPKTGISQRSQAQGSTDGANDRSPQAAPAKPMKTGKEKS